MKTKFAHLTQRLTTKRLVAMVLAFASVVVCIVGAVLGSTLATASSSLQGASPASAVFGGGTARAFLEENPDAEAAAVDDTLNLTLEAARPSGDAAPINLLLALDASADTAALAAAAADLIDSLGGAGHDVVTSVLSFWVPQLSQEQQDELDGLLALAAAAQQAYTDSLTAVIAAAGGADPGAGILAELQAILDHKDDVTDFDGIDTWAEDQSWGAFLAMQAFIAGGNYEDMITAGTWDSDSVFDALYQHPSANADGDPARALTTAERGMTNALFTALQGLQQSAIDADAAVQAAADAFDAENGANRTAWLADEADPTDAQTAIAGFVQQGAAAPVSYEAAMEALEARIQAQAGDGAHALSDFGQRTTIAVLLSESGASYAGTAYDALAAAADQVVIGGAADIPALGSGDAAGMSNVMLYGKLPEHVNDNFDVTGIVLSVGGETYTYDPAEDSWDEALPAQVFVTHAADNSGVYEFQLEGDLAEGERFSATLQLTFDREGFDPTVTVPGVLTDMLEGAGASYVDDADETQSQALAAPQIMYPTADGELAAAVNVQVNGGPVGDGFVNEGDVVRYQLLITNNGGSDLDDIQAEFPLPAGTAFLGWIEGEALQSAASADTHLRWEIPLLQAGEDIELTFEVTVDPLTTDYREILGYAIVAGERAEGALLEQYAGGIAANITVSPMDGAAVAADETITYTATVRNVSGSAAEQIAVDVELLAGAVTEDTPSCTPAGGNITGEPGNWIIETLDPGETAVLVYAVQANALEAEQASQEYHAAVTVSDAERTYAAEQFYHYQFGSELQARLSSQPARGTSVYAGQQIDYTIELYNDGPIDLEAIPVSCVIPAGTSLLLDSVSPAPAEAPEAGATELAWVIPTLAPGGTETLTFSVTVQNMPAGLDTRSIECAAIVAGNATNAVAHSQSAVLLDIEKTGSLTDEIVNEGDEITYTIKVTNEGDEPAYGIEIIDALPANLDYIVGSATASHPSDATGTGTPVDIRPGCTVDCEITADGTTEEGVDQYQFRWTVNKLMPGESAEVTFQARVTALPSGSAGRAFENIAYVNGEATNDVTYRQQGGSLSAEKTAAPAPGGIVRAGDTILYSVQADNTDTATKYGLVITDELPAEISFDDSYTPNVTLGGVPLTFADLLPDDDGDKAGLFTYSITGNTIQFVIGAVPADGSAEAFFQAEVLAPAEEGSESTRNIVNIAEVDGMMTNSVTHIQALSDLAAVKSALPASGETVYTRNADGSGSRITYSIQVTNTSGGRLEDIEILDELPAGLVYVTGSMTAENDTQPLGDTQVQGTLGGEGTSFAWVVEALEAEESVTVQFSADVTALEDGNSRTFSNTAQAGGKNSNTVVHNQYASSISADKTANPVSGAVEEDDIITYTITVRNEGGADETDLVISDAIPAGTEYVEDSAALTINGSNAGAVAFDSNTLTGTITLLQPGQAALMTFQVKVLAADEEDRSISNQAYVGEALLATNTVAHEQSGTGGPTDLPEITAEKYASSGAPVALGGTIQYSIKLENTGTANATLTEVYDEIPAGTSLIADSILGGGFFNSTLGRVEWSVEDIAPGESVILGFTAEVTAAQAGSVTNTAMVDGTATNPVTHEVLPPDLYAEKAADLAADADLRPSDTLTYTITVYNNTDAAMTNVPVLDVIPAGTSYVEDSANNGGVYDAETGSITWALDVDADGSAACSFQVKVDDIESGQKTITNRAFYSLDGIPDIFTNEVSRTASANVAALEAKLEAAPGIDHIFQPGETITYTITVSNTGNVALTNLQAEFPIPEGTTYSGSLPVTDGKLTWAIASLAVGGTETFTIEVTVNELAEGSSNAVISAKATVTLDGTDTQTNDVVRYVGGVPNVQVTKGADVPEGPAEAGSTLTYTLNVNNRGTAAATGIEVRDVLPEGVTFLESEDGSYDAEKREISWEIDALAADADKTLSFSVKVDSNTGSTAVSVKNTAYYVPGDGFAEVATNELTHTVQPGTAALRVSKAADKPAGSLVKPDDIITYTLTLNNDGEAALAALVLTDTLPAGLEYVDGSASSDGQLSGGTISWGIASLDAGAETLVTFQAKVLPAAAGETGTRTLRNIAQAGGTQSNASDLYVLGKVDQPHVSAFKSASPDEGLVQPGGEIVYTITAANDGNQDLTAVAVTDTIPEGTQLVSISDGGTEADGKITWTIDLEEDATQQLSFRVQVKEDAKEIRNKAHISGPNEADTNEIVHTVAGTPVEPESDLKLVKTNSKGENSNVQPGEIILYTLTVTNHGDAESEAVILSDTIPSGAAYVAESVSDNGELKDGVLTWDIGKLAAGTSKSVTFKAAVKELPAGTATAVLENLGYVNNTLGGSTKNMVTPRPLSISAFKRSSLLSSGSKAAEGSTYTYFIDVTNNTNAPVKGVAVTDKVPEGVTLVKASIDGGGSETEGLITWSLDLDAKETKTVSFLVTVDSLAKGTSSAAVRNTAMLDGTPTNEVLTYAVSKDNTDPDKDEDKDKDKDKDGDINITVGDINIGSGNTITGNNSNNNNTTNSNNTTTGSNNTGSNSTGSSSVGGKGIPKTSEASALWAILLVLISAAVIAPVTILLVRRKKASK